MSMTLLERGTLTARAAVFPESMALNLEERNSTATVTLGPEAPAVEIGDWIRDETEPGAGIVWRVRTVTEDVNKSTRTVALEHMIQTLKDRVLFGEHTAGMMTGDSAASHCGARAAMAYILTKQGTWRLGETADNPVNPYHFSGETLWAAMEAVTASIADAQWEYDFSTLPFTIHVRRCPPEFTGELRMSRNITTLRRQIDRTRMYTRHYPIGKNNLHISGDYVSRNENLYGIICKVETDQSKDSEEKLRAWSEQRLARHCEPTVTDTIGGIDLSRATGEPLDKITLGRKCRVPLPEQGAVIIEKVTKLSWADKIRKPDEFMATLGNQLEDVASIVNSMQQAAGGGGRAAAKEAEEDHAWFVDTTEKVGMVAEAVAGPGADKDWSRVSSIFVDGTGIHQKVTKAQDDIIQAEARIEINEDAIRQEVEKRIAEDQSLLGRIQVQADRVGMVVGTKDGKNYIKAAEICAWINEDGSGEAMISASKIHLLGQVIAQQINADYISAQIARLTVLRAQRLSVSGGADVSGILRARSYRYGNDEDLLETFRFVRKTTDGNDITLTFQRANGGSQSVTFSRATALEGTWSSGVYKVKASPQDEEIETRILAGTGSWDAGVCTIPVRYSDGSGEGATGLSCTARVNKSDIIASRSGRYSSDPSHDSVLTTVTQNGYYLVTVTVHGTSRTFRIQVNVA